LHSARVTRLPPPLLLHATLPLQRVTELLHMLPRLYASQAHARPLRALARLTAHLAEREHPLQDDAAVAAGAIYDALIERLSQCMEAMGIAAPASAADASKVEDFFRVLKSDLVRCSTCPAASGPFGECYVPYAPVMRVTSRGPAFNPQRRRKGRGAAE